MFLPKHVVRVVLGLVFLLCLTNIKIAVFAAIGLLTGIAIKPAIKTLKREIARPSWVIAIAIFLSALAMTSELVRTFQKSNYPVAAGPLTYRYQGRAEYFPETKLWSIDDEITIPKERELEVDYTVEFYKSSLNNVHTFSEMMARDGWNQTRNDEPTYTKTRSRPAESRWVPVHTRNTIDLPLVSQQFSVLHLEPRVSTLRLITPKYTIGKTYPPYVSRNDLLRNDKEELAINVHTYDEGFPSVRIELLSPLLRNEPGWAVSRASLWEPLKWIVLLLAGIFNDEIKAIATPVVRKLFPTWIRNIDATPAEPAQSSPDPNTTSPILSSEKDDDDIQPGPI
jgi:hypothetical protein